MAAIDPAAVLRAVDEWLAAGGTLLELDERHRQRLRRLRRGELRTITLEQLDELLVAMDVPWLLHELAPLERNGRGGYTWPKPHPLRKLSEAHVLAAHRLHVDHGWSLRELARHLGPRLGYASEHSCLEGLRAAFRRHGLPVRSRLEAVQLSNDSRGYVRGRDTNTRRRAARARRRATDPDFRAGELARLDALHEAERRRSSQPTTKEADHERRAP